MNLTDQQQAQAKLDSYLNQETTLKQQIEQFEEQTKKDDPHAQRLLARHKRMLSELQEDIKKLKQTTQPQGKK